MVDKLRLLRHVWRHLGPGWLAFRAGYAVRSRTGWLRRRMPAIAWTDVPLEEHLRDGVAAEPDAYVEYRSTAHPAAFFFRPSDRDAFQGWWGRDEEGPAVATAEALCAGRFTYFSRTELDLGVPPDWHANPFTGETIPGDRHWSQVSTFGHGDIKVIREPSRFAFAYPLVRAYWRTGNEAYPELFWQLVESWRDANPPNQGSNWMCGQDTSLRVMAWCFGLYGFADSPATTPERTYWLARMIAASGQRIEANIGYALSQNNNHGISEAVGLWTIGLLFPEFRAAKRWRERGRRALEDLGRRLLYDDGAFCQHSTNYHRLVLHDYLWALRLAELNGRPLSADLRNRIGQAALFLCGLQDGVTGHLPRYGPDDGALVLPLSDCAYGDFRPALQTAGLLCYGERWYSSGPWDEEPLWLLGRQSLQMPEGPPSRGDFSAEVGGCYAIRSPSGFASMRCADFRHRPSHADQLNVDLWWQGTNIAVDGGTYSYNAGPPWDIGLESTRYHNTVLVDGQDQMDRAGRFLWLPWSQGHVRQSTRRSKRGSVAYWEGEHDGYHRFNPPVAHCRAVAQIGDAWAILDCLDSRSSHDYCLHWLLNDFPHKWDDAAGRVVLDTPRGVYSGQCGALGAHGSYSLVRADDHSPRGWRSPHYLCREPALSMMLCTRAARVTFWTVFAPETPYVLATPERLEIAGHGTLVFAEAGTTNLDGRLLVSLLQSTKAPDDALIIVPEYESHDPG